MQGCGLYSASSSRSPTSPHCVTQLQSCAAPGACAFRGKAIHLNQRSLFNAFGRSWVGRNVFYIKDEKCSQDKFERVAKARWVVRSQASNSNTCQMTVSITGATGFIGKKLVEKLTAEGHVVRVLTRSYSKARLIFPEKDFPKVEIKEPHQWEHGIQGSTGVVNLAGPRISTRWTEEVKVELKQSRLDVTTKVVEIINRAPKDLRPTVLVNATAVGYYGTSETSAFDETSPSGGDYLAEICRECELTAQNLDGDTRLVRLRIGIVLDKDGGALAQMVPLFKVFAGGPLGSGRQWFSWVHRDDLVSLIVEALKNPAYKGVINGTAPNPVRMAEVCDRIGAVLGRPSWLPVPEFALRVVLGEGATLVLEGQRVLPKRAQELGFNFKYRFITDALRQILAA